MSNSRFRDTAIAISAQAVEFHQSGANMLPIGQSYRLSNAHIGHHDKLSFYRTPELGAAYRAYVLLIRLGFYAADCNDMMISGFTISRHMLFFAPFCTVALMPFSRRRHITVKMTEAA